MGKSNIANLWKTAESRLEEARTIKQSWHAINLPNAKIKNLAKEHITPESSKGHLEILDKLIQAFEPIWNKESETLRASKTDIDTKRKLMISYLNQAFAFIENAYRWLPKDKNQDAKQSYFEKQKIFFEIAQNFLKDESLKEYLTDENVRSDLKSLSKSLILIKQSSVYNDKKNPSKESIVQIKNNIPNIKKSSVSSDDRSAKKRGSSPTYSETSLNDSTTSNTSSSPTSLQSDQTSSNSSNSSNFSGVMFPVKNRFNPARLETVTPTKEMLKKQAILETIDQIKEELDRVGRNINVNDFSLFSKLQSIQNFITNSLLGGPQNKTSP